MCLWEHCPSVFPASSAEGIHLPLTPTLHSAKPGDVRRDSLHALRIKGQNVRQNMSNYLFVSPLQYEEEVSVYLQFVLEFIFYRAQCYCNSCCALSMQFWSCSLRKIFVNVHELSIGQFLHIFYGCFGLFCFVRPDEILFIKCCKKGKKLSLCHIPSHLHYMCRSSRGQTGSKKVKNLGA